MAFFTTLYSGSSGNCGVIESHGRFLLVDMGKSCRTTVTGLKELGLSPEQLGGVLITHEHTDHVGGLTVFLKKYPVPVYGCEATLTALSENGILPDTTEQVPVDGSVMDVAGFGVKAFSTSHDVPCCGYRVETPEGKTMAIATDLGTITPVVHENLSGVDLVALEANYDLQSLRMGPYPYYLKRRIESNHGHLCNDECAAKLLELIQEGCRKFALCHMSKENNTRELVLGTVRQAVVAANIKPEKGTVVQVQQRLQISPVLEF